MSPIRMSRIESAVRVVLEFNGAFNRHDVPGMMQLMSEDCVFETADPPPDGAAYSGKEAVSQFLQNFFIKSPHAHMEIEDIFGFGSRCVTLWRNKWEDTAGKDRHIRGIDLYQVENGLICKKLSYIKGSYGHESSK